MLSECKFGAFINPTVDFCSSSFAFRRHNEKAQFSYELDLLISYFTHLTVDCFSLLRQLFKELDRKSCPFAYLAVDFDMSFMCFNNVFDDGEA